MYAKIDSTTWDWQSPTRSSLKGCDREFDHEMDCPRHERMDKDCDCYVSRIRLVKTPVGEFIPTTDPDLAPQVVFWEKSARMWKRSTYICAAAAGASLAVSILTALGVF